MSNIYVPLDASGVQSKIPAGEDVVYSTYMKAVFIRYDLSTTETTTFITHVLMTKNGFAWAYPQGPKGSETLDLKYTPWLEVWSFDEGQIYVDVNPKPKHLIKMFRDRFQLARGEKLETEESFAQRQKDFPLKILPVAIECKQKWLDQSRNTAEKGQVKDQSKWLSTLQKEYAKFAKKAGM